MLPARPVVLAPALSQRAAAGPAQPAGRDHPGPPRVTKTPRERQELQVLRLPSSSAELEPGLRNLAWRSDEGRSGKVVSRGLCYMKITT